MSALTTEVGDPRSPVALWLRSTFPHAKAVQSVFRTAAGTVQVLPGPAVAPGTQGAAIDWWLRFLTDPAPSLALAAMGLYGRQELPCYRAGVRLLTELGAFGHDGRVGPVDPARFAGRPDEWWARVSYALALLVELYRGIAVRNSRLFSLRADSGAGELLSLANADEVADLIAMRDLARERLLPRLPAGPVFTGSTFDGSADLAADADLIAGGLLVDFKASRGGNRRSDGTRSATLARTDLDQLLGYALMDYSDRYRLHSIAIYAARYGYLAVWRLDLLLDHLAGRPVDLGQLRQQFAEVLRVALPPYARGRQEDRLRALHAKRATLPPG